MPTSRAIIITRPDHDILNKYFYLWSKAVIEEAKRHTIQILDLDKDKATKQLFTSYINKINPRIVFMNGHGTNDEIMGINNQVIIKAHENEGLLRGKIVYIRSCSVVNGLGALCLTNKIISAFIGYSRRFIVGLMPSSYQNPLGDRVARLFLEPSNLIPISLIKGNSAEQAHKKSLAVMYKNFLYMISSKATFEEQSAASWLWRNMKYQVLLGNKSAKL